MSINSSNITLVPLEIKAVILQEVITKTGSLQCRLVCKEWKQITDEKVFKLIALKLRSELAQIPETLGLKSIVTTFTDSMSPTINTAISSDLDKAKEFGTNMAITIGGYKPRVIASADQIAQLTQKDTNLHILWNYIKTKVTNAPQEHKTCEQISFWMSRNEEALKKVTSLDQCCFPTPNILKSIPWEIEYLSHLYSEPHCGP